ncbi:MAG: hypothetical protein ACJ780_10185 [Solirubrobacteraceae bacterium]|jgi:hypothetical protein
MPRQSFRLADFSDRELLALMRDVGGEEGVCSTRDIAEAADVGTKHPLTNVGVRLGYLRRIGMLERDPETRKWYLTPLGERFVRGKLTPGQRRALEALRDEGAAWAATESLARLLGDADTAQATMMRRQWQHGWAQRNHRH